MSGTIIDVAAPAEDAPEREETPRAEGARRLYAVVWRWHFYAGLLTAPLMWVVTLTGALYAFRTEIVEWRDRPWLVVEPGPQRKGLDELIEVAKKAGGSDELEGMALRPEPDRSVRFMVEGTGTGGHDGGPPHVDVYVNPYTGDVLGTRTEGTDVFDVVLALHRNLMYGSTGRALVELTTAWGLILLATGVYLWWPRGKTNVGVWTPRLKGKLYAVLRDWHSVPGFYLAALIGIVTATGLVFSLVMGSTFNWSVQKIGHWPPAWMAPPKAAPAPPGASAAPLDVVAANFLKEARPGEVVAFRPAAKPELNHRAWISEDDDKNRMRAVTADRWTGEVISSVAPADLPFMYRVRLWSVSTHVGKIFGLTTEILACVASLAMFALSATGVWMWWERRPRNRTGFPRRPEPKSLPRWGWLIVVVGGVLLPVAGASMVLVVLLDALAYPLRKRWA
ncbi:MAG: hypothetical protein BGO49_25470 [Planctomycetales bacterium 71-10]|nr:MAG: hypothetical protein BGO49_25470 [Planctomycetales bacterium 71-10]